MRENGQYKCTLKSHRTATVTTGPHSNPTNTKQMKPTDLPNSSPFHATTTTAFTDCVYLSEEEETVLKCRRFSIGFNLPKKMKLKRKKN